ncbi:Crp/Fnr family transcriptional regulator [Hymenobacter crusticola]|uniref:Crp/Fnr family transcriptional regulator n=1 Tax=Hymenobacter crusticola TaxID=1770526 RepID=A0A243W7W0_9BACT|nr:Crp/Fnr family transcriptional regulator [Hymenobacter crusticola]OUJ71137.1 Crp/Fnr family transcriptional regulator [Hymenobacter crusticola]
MSPYTPFLQYLQLFRDIPLADQELLTQSLRHRSLPENEVLVRPGQVCQEMYFIVRGVLRIMAPHENGSEATCFFLKENQLCTILASFLHQVPATEGIQTACPAELLVLPHAGLYQLYAQLSYLQPLIDLITQRTLLDKIQVRNQYLGESAAARYQKFLLHQPDIALRVSLRDVASYLGITQQSLSRIRRQLASE